MDEPRIEMNNEGKLLSISDVPNLDQIEIDPRNGGVSHAGVRNTVIAFVAHRIKPKLITEYGFGQGLYGIGLRGNEFDGALIGVDAWAPDIPRVHRYGGVYDVLICADVVAYEMLFTQAAAGTGGITICGDMIEHLDKQRATWLLKRLAARDSIVVTPTFYNPQVAIGGNPYEEHRCFITREEFEADGWELLVNGEYTAKMIENTNGTQVLREYPGLVEAFMSPPLAKRGMVMKDIHITRKGRRIIIKAGNRKEAKKILGYLPDKMCDILETCEGYRQIGFQCDDNTEAEE